MLSPWCTAWQEHVTCNYGFFSSIKTHASTRITPVHVYIILLACDQIRVPLCLCTKVDPDTPSLLAERRDGVWRCGKRMQSLSGEWKPWWGEALYLCFSWPLLSNREHQVLQTILRSSALFRWQGSAFFKASSFPLVVVTLCLKQNHSSVPVPRMPDVHHLTSANANRQRQNGQHREN